MEQALASIVLKLSDLGYQEDGYRNGMSTNQYLHLQHFCKKVKDSPWEAFVAYNPHNQIVSLNYFEVYGNVEKYVKSVVRISDDLDAETACSLISVGTNNLWDGNTLAALTKPNMSLLFQRLEKIGFKKSNVKNRITKWVYEDQDKSFSILTENGVGFSVYMFEHTESKVFPILIARDIKGDEIYDSILALIRRKTL